MPPQPLSGFAITMAATPDLEAALLALRSEVAEVDPGAEVALFRVDQRRQLISSRLVPGAAGVTSTPMEISPDHLPQRLKRDVLGGNKLVDFGDQSTDYMKFLSFGNPTGGGYLLLHGVLFDGELYALLGIAEPKHRFGGRTADKLTPLVAVFQTALSRFAERDARKEAVLALEETTERLHAHYRSTLEDLKKQLAEAQHAAKLSGGADQARVAQLEAAATSAAEQAKVASERLTAVEQQVSAAVSQLEKAHLDLSRQTEQLRTQGHVLQRIERLLAERDRIDDPQKLLDEVVAAVTLRE